MNSTVDNTLKNARIAIVTMGVKLGDETRGYTRFRFLSELLCREGFDVTLITSSFQHWEKAQRNTKRACYQNLPYRIVFIDEPGYKKNLDLSRIISHHKAAKNLRTFFTSAFANKKAFDLIYSEIPPNDVARVCAEVASEQNIPYVADINDLWPEAMRMVVNLPLISKIGFYPFERDAKRTYQLLSAAVGTSDEYAKRPAADRTQPYPHVTVYVGNDLAAFDAHAAQNASAVKKPPHEIWVTYAGTLGTSYDLATLIQAATRAHAQDQRIRVKILGDGPDRAHLEALAAQSSAPVDFLGYVDYALMAAYLCASDMTINSLVKSAPQSIPTKIGDYLASANPLINTGPSPELSQMVDTTGIGVNVEAENASDLAHTIVNLACNEDKRAKMGKRARKIAEKEFDQPCAYQAIVDLIQSLL